MAFAIPDPRWEMPELLIPGKKPTGPVVIDWSHPLTRGLIMCVPMTMGPYPQDLVSGAFLSDVNASAVMEPTAKGMAANLQGANKQFKSTPLSYNHISGTLVIAAIFYGGDNPNGGLGGLSNSLSQTTPPYVTQVFRVQAGGNTTMSTNLGHTSFGEKVGTGFHVLAGTHRSGAQQVWIDGVSKSTGVGIGNLSSATQSNILVGSDYTLQTRNADADSIIQFAWDRVLSEREVISITRSLYQFLIPA